MGVLFCVFPQMFGIMKPHSRTLVENLEKTSKREEAADVKEYVEMDEQHMCRSVLYVLAFLKYQ